MTVTETAQWSLLFSPLHYSFFVFNISLYHSSFAVEPFSRLLLPLTPHPVPPDDGKRDAVRNEKAIFI
jgi:hypothetical protein